MSTEAPITVIIPAYNRAQEVPRALASVFGQDPLRAAEVLVIDDGSSDRTAEAAEEAGARVIRHEVNQGLAAARNTGLRSAAHDWVALLDSDDEWLPHHLETLWSLRDEHVLVAGSALWCGEDPARDRFHGPPGRSPEVLRSPAPLLFPENFLPVSAAMVRRDPALAAGGFRSRRGVVEDLDLWVRMLGPDTGVVSPRVTLIYHVHGSQMSLDHETMHAAHLEVLLSAEGRDWWSRTLVERWRGRSGWDMVRLALQRGDRRAAIAQAAAILARPNRIAGVVGTWVRRFRIRRRSAQVGRNGGPSVALLPGGSRERAGSMTQGGGRLVDLSGLDSRPRILLSLMRSPAAVAVVGSRLDAVLVRLAGVRPVLPEQAFGGSARS